MKKLLILLISASLHAQVTIRITSIPENTPSGASIYMAGNLNDWNPQSNQHIMQPDGLGAYAITIPEGTGTIEYKFTRGSWPTVEGNASGGFLPNRSFTFTGSPQSINVTVQSWEDIAGSGTNSTAAANVQIMNSAFYMPQLDRSRKIWIYLPPDYFTTAKHYPVLYMQDGQNLFDDATSFSGEWHVDETLNTLHAAGDYGAIVIGIENGGTLRLDEYSPWENPQYGGGEGELYMQFLSETLKPFVDANFRTRPEPQFNALAGSSMGALISAYGVARNPEQFGKAGLFSPAFWFALPQLNQYIVDAPGSFESLRMYFVGGQNESTAMAPHMNSVRNSFVSSGVSLGNTLVKVDSYGTHTEGYWSGEFAAAYTWLFQQEQLSVADFQNSAFRIFQNSDHSMVVSGIEGREKFSLYAISGQKVCDLDLVNGVNPLPDDLAPGIYIIRNNFHVMKIVK